LKNIFVLILIFLNDENHCKIYEVRPESARQAGCWISDYSNFVDMRDSWKNNELEQLYPKWKEMNI